MKVQAYTSHTRQLGARSLTQVLAFALLALHAAQLTVPHVANAVQLVTTGEASDTDADSDEESSVAGKKTDLQSEVQLLNHGRPRGLPSRADAHTGAAEAMPARHLHAASLSIPAQAHHGLPHRHAQLVRLLL